MGIRESHSLLSVVWAHQKTALTIRGRSAGHRLPVSTRLLAPRRWIYMASATPPSATVSNRHSQPHGVGYHQPRNSRIHSWPSHRRSIGQ